MHNHCGDFYQAHHHHQSTYCWICKQYYCLTCGMLLGQGYWDYPSYPVYPVYPDWTWRPWMQPTYVTYTSGNANSNITYSSM